MADRGDSIRILKPSVDKMGVRVPVALGYLKSEPVETVVISPMQALELAEQLTAAARRRITGDTYPPEES